MKRTLSLPLFLLLTVSTVESAIASDYSAIVRAERAAAYYRLEETTVAASAAENQSGLTGNYTTNSIGYPHVGAPGISTNAIVFAQGPNGANDDGYVTIPASPVVAPVNTDGVTGATFSVEVWANPSNSAPSDYLSVLSMCGPAIGGSTVNGSGWDFSETPGPTALWQFTMRTQNGISSLVSTTPASANQWAHLAATWDGTTATFYVNGVAQKTAALSGYVPAAGASGAIGAGPNTGHRGFIGAIDEVAFYTNALPQPSWSNHFVIGIQHVRVPTVSAVATDPSQPTQQ